MKLRTWIKVILVVALALAAVNDTGRYVMALYRLDDKTLDMAFESAQIAKVNPASNSGWPAAAKIAQDSGIEITGYGQNARGASVATRVYIYNTYLVGPIRAIIMRRPLNSPMPIEEQFGSY